MILLAASTSLPFTHSLCDFICGESINPLKLTDRWETARSEQKQGNRAHGPSVCMTSSGRQPQILELERDYTQPVISKRAGDLLLGYTGQPGAL